VLVLAREDTVSSGDSPRADREYPESTFNFEAGQAGAQMDQSATGQNTKGKQGGMYAMAPGDLEIESYNTEEEVVKEENEDEEEEVQTEYAETTEQTETMTTYTGVQSDNASEQSRKEASCLDCLLAPISTQTQRQSPESFGIEERESPDNTEPKPVKNVEVAEDVGLGCFPCLPRRSKSNK
jgi:hypothetical protein